MKKKRIKANFTFQIEYNVNVVSNEKNRSYLYETYKNLAKNEKNPNYKSYQK